MPANHKIIQLRPPPGIERDGTPFDNKSFINGQHVRFYKGLPRKIGGYQLLAPGTVEPIRTLFSVPRSNSFDLYIGRGSGVYVAPYFTSHIASPEHSRTPVEYVPDPNNIWEFDLCTGSATDGSSITYIIAHVRPDSDQLNSSANGAIYFGDITSTAPLEQMLLWNDITPYPDPSPDPLIFNGGIVCIPPFLFAFGEGGVVAWSKEGNPLNWPAANIASISPYKIIAGRLARGGVSPSALFWSTNSLVRATFISTTLGFSFNTVDDDISIISDTSIVKVGQIYYWIGVDQFYTYTGVVQPLKNAYSTDWFFNNVNKAQLDNIFGVHVKRYGEIWWFYPKGNSPVCTDVIIYNYIDQIWYDTVLPRSAGISANGYNYPIMADSFTIRNLSDPRIANTYPIWTQEIGNNRILFNQILAIDSFIETPIMDLFELSGIDQQLRIRRIEPDAEQVGDMEVKVITRGFAQGEVTVSDPYIFSPDTPKIDMSEMGRLVSFQFRSNTLDGYFQMGKILLNIAEGDVRPNN
jgi:hypothetical protein